MDKLLSISSWIFSLFAVFISCCSLYADHFRVVDKLEAVVTSQDVNMVDLKELSLQVAIINSGNQPALISKIEPVVRYRSQDGFVVSTKLHHVEINLLAKSPPLTIAPGDIYPLEIVGSIHLPTAIQFGSELTNAEFRRNFGESLEKIRRVEIGIEAEVMDSKGNLYRSDAGAFEVDVSSSMIRQFRTIKGKSELFE